MIDVKDLMPAKLSEIKPGYIFYVKNDDGTFHQGKIEADELNDFKRKTDLLWITKKLHAEGRLFRRINAPGKSFAK